MVTITGSLAKLAAGGFGVAGIPGGRVEIVPVAAHPDLTPSYGFTDSLMVRPLAITLDSGGAIPAATTILVPAAFRPAGCVYEVTWVASAITDGEERKVPYRTFVGPDGGTCDLTDQAFWLLDHPAPVLAEWPATPPVTIYSSQGS